MERQDMDKYGELEPDIALPVNNPSKRKYLPKQSGFPVGAPFLRREQPRQGGRGMTGFFGGSGRPHWGDPEGGLADPPQLEPPTPNLRPGLGPALGGGGLPGLGSFGGGPALDIPRRPPPMAPQRQMLSGAPSDDEEDPEKITCWSIEREAPNEAYNPKTKSMTKTTGWLCDLDAEKYSNQKVVEYIKKNYGGGSYIIFSCNSKGEQLGNRPVTISMMHPPLDGEGHELLLVNPNDKDEDDIGENMGNNTRGFPSMSGPGSTPVVQGNGGLAYNPVGSGLGNFIGDLGNAHQSQINMLKEALEQKGNTIENLHKELNSVRDYFTRNENQIKSDHQKEMTEIRSNFQERLSEMRNELQETKNHSLQSLSSEREAHQKELTSARESYQRDMSQLREENSRLTLELSNKTQEIRRELGQQLENVAREKDRVQSEFIRDKEKALQEQQNRYETELRETRKEKEQVERDWRDKKERDERDLINKYEMKLKDLENELKNEYRDLKMQRDTENRELNARITNLERDLTTKAIEMEKMSYENNRRLEIEKMESLNASKNAELKSRLDRLQESSQNSFQTKMLEHFMEKKGDDPIKQMKSLIDLQNSMSDLTGGGGVDLDLDKEEEKPGFLDKWGGVAASTLQGLLGSQKPQAPQIVQVPVPMATHQAAPPWARPMQQSPWGGVAPQVMPNPIAPQAPVAQPPVTPVAQAPQANPTSAPGNFVPINIPTEDLQRLIPSQEAPQGAPAPVAPQVPQPQAPQPQVPQQPQPSGVYANPALKSWLQQGIQEHKDPQVWAETAMKFITDEGKEALLEVTEENVNEIMPWLEKAGIEPESVIPLVIIDQQAQKWVFKAVQTVQDLIYEEIKQELIAQGMDPSEFEDEED